LNFRDIWLIATIGARTFSSAVVANLQFRDPTMPLLGLMLLAIDVTLVVHAAKTGRFSPWAYIILMIPVAIAYVVGELVPEWLGSYQGQHTRRRVGKALNPEKAYRALKDQVEIADTIANRQALAEECLELGKFEEAEAQYDAILAKPLGDEPGFALGRARAQFGQGRFREAKATLDDLRQRWPDYQSADGHLLYARALEEDGDLNEAIEEYEAVSNYFVGIEPRVRYGLALRKVGREAEARAVLADVVQRMSKAPRFARKVQAQWIAMAEAALRA
jgi:hypothetical protein